VITSFNFVPPVVAHRGASAYAPENTMAAFMQAAQLGAKWLEFDVMLAACGTPIVFHDEILDRTTNGHGAVHSYPYTVLQTLDAGSWFQPQFTGERIPTCQQVLDFLYDTGMHANIELKPLPGQEEALVLQVLKIIAGKSTSFLFSSFSIPTLYYLRQHAPTCAIGLLMDNLNLDWQQVAKALQCISIHVYDGILTPALAQKIQNMRKQLLCYTVNEPLHAHTLFSWGVDAVFSDAPDKIIANNKE
jgi:glycerophosphoryl diester phosphodiesterase